MRGDLDPGVRPRDARRAVILHGHHRLDPIGAPVADQVDTAIIMDQPSLAKYQQQVRPAGILLSIARW